jgi:hypothetical protein
VTIAEPLSSARSATATSAAESKRRAGSRSVQRLTIAERAGGPAVDGISAPPLSWSSRAITSCGVLPSKRGRPLNIS